MPYLYRAHYALVIALVLLCSGPARADVIVQYDFSGNDGDDPVNASAVATNVGASSLSLVGGLGVVGTLGANTAQTYGVTDWSTASTINTTQYIEWTVTADPGFFLDLESLTYYLIRSGSGPQSVVIRSSVDSFAADLTTLPGSPVNPQAGTGFLGSNPQTPTTVVADLSGASFDMVSSITFRLFGYDAGSDSGQLRLVNSAVAGSGSQPWTLDGTVVPEPAGMATLLAAGGLLVLRRRRGDVF